MKPKITQDEAYEMYDNMLDECYPINIGYLNIEPSKVLGHFDPIGYRTGFNEYLDFLNEEYDTSDWY